MSDSMTASDFGLTPDETKAINLAIKCDVFKRRDTASILRFAMEYRAEIVREVMRMIDLKKGVK